MKVDIEKIKAEYEQKVQEAIIVNNILDVLGDEEFRVYAYNGHCNKGKKTLSFHTEETCGQLSIEKVGLVLSKLNQTEKIKVYVGDNKYIQMDYEVRTSRSYRDSFATLTIEYIHNEYEIRIELPIEPNKALNGFFADGLRKVDKSEITTYYIVSRPGRRAADVQVPVKLFANGEYVRFKGGYVTSSSEWAANNIIEAIKESYMNANQESNQI